MVFHVLPTRYQHPLFPRVQIRRIRHVDPPVLHVLVEHVDDLQADELAEVEQHDVVDHRVSHGPVLEEEDRTGPQKLQETPLLFHLVPLQPLEKALERFDRVLHLLILFFTNALAVLPGLEDDPRVHDRPLFILVVRIPVLKLPIDRLVEHSVTVLFDPDRDQLLLDGYPLLRYLSDADESLPHRLLELQPGVVPPHDFDAPQDRGLVVVERERLPNPRGQRDLAVLVRQRFPDRFVVERRVDPALRLCVVELTLLICLGQVRLLQGVPHRLPPGHIGLGVLLRLPTSLWVAGVDLVGHGEAWPNATFSRKRHPKRGDGNAPVLETAMPENVDA
mmetsp:Transcript_3380/g.8050  ORF Transcript_3380/g.8050 Transcript_3380/m.8050 type:complete len:334 (-) Transcript_3380:28-1029(-)